MTESRKRYSNLERVWKMSEGFRNVPGVPDGWELVRVGVPDSEDWLIGHDGNPVAHCMLKRPLKLAQYAIIRKIEKPAKYRPFANAEEFKAHPLSGGWVLLGAGVWGRVLSFSDDYVSTSDTHPDEYTWGDAFSDLLFDDGIPFGVRIDE